MIITIRTDKPESEIGIYDIDRGELDYHRWEAHRQLSTTILSVIEDLLKKNDLGYSDVTGVVFFEGPGSFTGLRIGASVANSMAYGLNVPAVAVGTDEWIAQGLLLLSQGKNGVVLPQYGAEPHITAQKK